MNATYWIPESNWNELQRRINKLARRAIERTKEVHATCSKPNGSDPNSEGSKAISRLAIELDGRLKALEIVLEAMHGNKSMLRHWGEP